ncbi:MAG: EamA family transporter [Candidatus Dormiibacterota bacterium]
MPAEAGRETRSDGEATRRLRWRQSLIGGVALLAVYLCWGSTYNAIAVGDRTVPPLLFIAVRFLIAGVVLLPLAGRRTRPWQVPPRQWRSTAISGVLMLAGGTGLVAVGERTVPGGVAALLVATTPIWMLLPGILRHPRTLRLATVAGIGIGLGGVVVLLAPSGRSHVDLLGAGTVLLSAMAWAAGALHSRRADEPTDPLLASAMQMLAAGVVLLVAALSTGELGQVALTAFGWSGGLALGWLVTVGSLVGFSAYLTALRLLPLQLVSTHAFVNPLVAVLIGATLFGSALTLQVGLAAGLTVTAVAVLLLPARGRGRGRAATSADSG